MAGGVAHSFPAERAFLSRVQPTGAPARAPGVRRDAITPKGLHDRTESGHVLQRAHALAAGLHAAILPVIVDVAWDMEHGVPPTALAAALAAARRIRAGTLSLPAARAAPALDRLTVTMAAHPAAAWFGPVEQVALEAAGGRIAAEVIAPAPPGIPSLMPGQRIEPSRSSG